MKVVNIMKSPPLVFPLCTAIPPINKGKMTMTVIAVRKAQVALASVVFLLQLELPYLVNNIVDFLPNGNFMPTSRRIVNSSTLHRAISVNGIRAVKLPARKVKF
jgi:hypothetical protein